MVAIDAYGFTNTREPLNRKLCAAENDLKAMVPLLDGAGFTTRVLKQGEATRAAIEKGLLSLAANAQSGSDVVFYFSGCGGAQGGVPTLVPADGLEAKATNDVSMAKVEAMANAAWKKGAHVTVVVDACFGPPPELGGRGLEGRVFKRIPKCAPRPGAQVRQSLYAGKGVFLCPAQNQGAAYEWLPAGPETWTSVFTDYLAAVATDAILKGRLPAVRTMMREADAYFKPRVSDVYLHGMSVALPASATDPLYDASFLTSGNLPPLKDAQKGQAQRRVAAVQARERTLSVGVEVDPSIKDPGQRQALKNRIIELKAPIEAKKGVKLVSAYNSRTDRVLTISDEGGFTIRVKGGDLTQRSKAVFAAADPASAVATGLDAYLEGEMFAKRLWTLAERSAESPTWNPKLARETIRLNEKLEFGFDVPSGGYLYILNRDDADDEVKLLFPNLYENDPYFPPGAHTAPKNARNLEGSSTPGHSVLMTLFVPTPADLPPLPAYRKEDTPAQRSRAFEGPLAKHLEELLTRLEGGLPYGARRLEYTIPP